LKDSKFDMNITKLVISQKKRNMIALPKDLEIVRVEKPILSNFLPIKQV